MCYFEILKNAIERVEADFRLNYYILEPSK